MKKLTATMATATGLDVLVADFSLQKRFKGNVGYLCHNASVDKHLREGIGLMQQIFGKRLRAIFSPQHGLFGEAQDNMVESAHFTHPHFGLPVFSLYSETRSPTPAMLAGLDHIFVDLQDVGCRAYTFIFTLTLLMEACAKTGIEVVVLDRPNPLGGQVLAGNVLEEKFRSFIGRHALPMRHGLTIGEVATTAVRHWGIDCPLTVVPMQHWQRHQFFHETKLPWVFPSPNMPHLKTALVFPGMVLFEGTNLSEGRGTTRPFELIGHPSIRPHAWLGEIEQAFQLAGLEGCTLRPVYFQPTFDKHAGQTCGGFHLHVTNRRTFRPWHTGQILLREIYRLLGNDFQWRQPPFEYEEVLLPIDLLNGSDRPRLWVENGSDWQALLEMERTGPRFEVATLDGYGR